MEMAPQSLLKSLNWRFYSVLTILTVTIFIFVYNTFVINEINKDTHKDPPVLSYDTQTLKALQEQQLMQHKINQHVKSRMLEMQSEHNHNGINYNSPSLSNQLQSGFDQNILFHSDGYIIGNPLLQNECKNAIISQIPDRLLEFFPTLLPDLFSKHWFVSRESYSTLFTHSHHKKHYKTHSKREGVQYYSKTKVQTPIAKGFNNSRTTSYFNIEKSASSTTTTYLKRQTGEYEFEQNIIDSNTVVISNCSFTFVRDPLQRFVSAYYTVNRLMWDVENHPDRVEDHRHIANLRHLFKFLSVEGEPERFRAFVDDLSIFESVFIFGSRHLQHMMSQSAILSLPDLSRIGKSIEWFTDPSSGQMNDRFFVGRVEQYEQHWRKLTEICDDIVMYEKDLQLMPSYGARESLNQTYLKVMSLDTWKKGDILPAYHAIYNDRDTFAKIVNFYYQDYVCFGYTPKMPDFYVPAEENDEDDDE